MEKEMEPCRILQYKCHESIKNLPATIYILTVTSKCFHQQLGKTSSKENTTVKPQNKIPLPFFQKRLRNRVIKVVSVPKSDTNPTEMSLENSFHLKTSYFVQGGRKE